MSLLLNEELGERVILLHHRRHYNVVQRGKYVVVNYLELNSPGELHCEISWTCYASYQ